MGAAEASFEFAPAHLDECGATVGAGVGHVAGAEVRDEFLEFRAAEGIIGLHGVAADGLCDDVLADPQGVHAGSGGLEGVHQIEGEPTGIRGADERGQGVEEEGAFAEFAEADPEAVQDVEVAADEVSIPDGDFDRFREEQALGGCLGGFLHPTEHLFEQDPFVGGMLVQEDEAAIGFEDDVEASDDAYDPERDGEEGLRGGGSGMEGGGELAGGCCDGCRRSGGVGRRVGGEERVRGLDR